MPFAHSERQPLVFELECDDGHRCIVYNALAIRNPDDHEPDKWYVRPWPVMLPPGEPILGPYETAQQAERAVRARHRGRPGPSASRPGRSRSPQALPASGDGPGHPG